MCLFFYTYTNYIRYMDMQHVFYVFAFIRFCRERNPGLGAGGPRAAAHGAATTCGRTFSVCLVCLHHFSVFFSHFQPVFRHCKIVLAFILACHCNGLLLRRSQQLSQSTGKRGPEMRPEAEKPRSREARHKQRSREAAKYDTSREAEEPPGKPRSR